MVEWSGGSDEIVMRFETNNGFVAYSINGEELARRGYISWSTMSGYIPKLIRPIVDTFLFSLRHGVVNRLLKEQGLPPMDKQATDRDAEAIRCICLLMCHHVHNLSLDKQTGKVKPVDFTVTDLAGVYDGMVKRAPEYDSLKLPSEATNVYSEKELAHQNN